MSTTITLPDTGTWNIDPAHSVVSARVRHLVAAKVRGSFKSFSGSINVGDSPETSSARVSIDAASIDTGVPDRDAHLRSADFLDAEAYPTLDFVSVAVRPKGGTSYALDGELTIRGVTKPITLDMEYGGLVSDPWGGTRAVFSAETKIDREAWGMTWNQALEAGGWLVGKTIDVEIEIEAVKAS